jgi:hypothetical protein
MQEKTLGIIPFYYSSYQFPHLFCTIRSSQCCDPESMSVNGIAPQPWFVCTLLDYTLNTSWKTAHHHSAFKDSYCQGHELFYTFKYQQNLCTFTDEPSYFQ